MIPGYSPTVQALLATLFTWFVTALGAALVYLVPASLSLRRQRQVLDASLGFAAGVMLAASYWSLLAPALEFAEASGTYGAHSYVPVAIGLLAGAAFVYGADLLIPAEAGDTVAVLTAEKKKSEEENEPSEASSTQQQDGASLRKRHTTTSKSSSSSTPVDATMTAEQQTKRERQQSWHRILLLVIAIVIHNFPEGLAVGVGFGAINTIEPVPSKESVSPAIYAAEVARHASESTTLFNEARNLAIGIGLQNFPEGLAVSLPLMRVGFSRSSAFWYGQLSGMVEPVAGLLGAILVTTMRPILPYALAFAAGAMIFVVVEDLIPETRAPGGYPTLASGFVMIGFVVMMAMDVGLG